MAEDEDDPVELSSDVELRKKRKLREEQSGMPSPKHKFRDRCYGAEVKSTNDKENEDSMHDCPNEAKTDGRSGGRIEGCESVTVSNSFSEESDTSTMTVYEEAKPDTEIGKNYLQWPSISSSSSSIKNYRRNCYFTASIASESGEQSTRVDSGTNIPILGDDLKLERGFPSSDHLNLNDLEMNYYDCFGSEQVNNGEEQTSEIAAEEMKLYSNDATSNFYRLLSERCSANPDAGLGARTPTIDQEFEQYFSTMLL